MSWKNVRRVLRVAIPLLFVVVTAWTIIDLVSQGAPPPRRFGGELGAPPDPESVTIAVAADVGSGERAQATLDGMAAAQPDLHIMLGDLSDAGPASERAWCDLVRSRVGLVVPVQILAGNQEQDGSGDGFIGEFAQCLPDRLNSHGVYGREYYFDIGTLARIILISPDLTIGGEHYFYGDDTAHHRWLTDAIDGARAEGITWVIVGMHKNCISVGEHYCQLYQEGFDLLIRKRVDLVLSGHDRTYQRSKQLTTRAEGCPQVVIDEYDPRCVSDDGSDDEYRKGAGPVFLVAGTGGADLYDVHRDDPEAGYFSKAVGRNRQPQWGFMTLTVTPGSLTAQFSPSSAGGFRDRFVVQ